MPTNLTPRIVAGLLAAGGSCWGLLLLVFHDHGFPLPILLGYVVTAWYVARVFWTPPLLARRVMWVVSLAVQGWWLVSALLESGWPSFPLFVAWWVLAGVLSAVGLLTERAVVPKVKRVDGPRPRAGEWTRPRPRFG